MSASRRRGAVLVLVIASALAFALPWAPLARAHEMRPSLVELRERDDGTVEVIWKLALARGAPLPLELELPRCRPVSEVARDSSAAVLTRRWRVDCRGADGGSPLAGARVRVRGLEDTGTEVIARAQLLDGSRRDAVLRADAPSWSPAQVDGTRTGAAHAGVYLRVGVEHILGGPDHLLFVLGLVLVAVQRRPEDEADHGTGTCERVDPRGLVARARRRRAGALLAAVTAFTLAHSVTLVLAVLGLARPRSGAAIEAIIALSILLLAVELARARDPGAARSWTFRAPWVVALICGFVHGFGFAGALAQLGLPEGAAALALALFNLGVELGQLVFVTLALLIAFALTRALPSSRGLLRVTTYALGACAAYWLIDRLRVAFSG